MNIQDTIDLMIRSSNNDPYAGDLDKTNNLRAVIDLAKLCKEFADNGQTDEAMNLNSEHWVIVIEELKKKLIQTIIS